MKTPMEPSTQINAILEPVSLPRMARVRQTFDAAALSDPQRELWKTLDRPELKATIRPGMRVAITAGSRGIDNILLVLRETVAFVRALGAEPFLIPAMGSHGGATAEGQLALLAGYGITEESVGAPIYATMEVTQIASFPDGTPVFIDRYAAQADGIIVINRVKPHTNFRHRYESGLFKMMAIGLGKQYGAAMVHGADPREMGLSVERFGRAILQNARILFGVALVENAYDKTALIQALTPAEIESQEPLLLEKAKSLMPRICFEDLDILIVDRIGKNISGPGMDPNITFTFLRETGISTARRATRVVVLDLSDETHGAANGIGLADMTTRRVFEKMDINKTYPNTLTGRMPESSKLPMFFDTQKYAIQAAALTAIGADPKNLRVVRIRDTLHLSEIQISEALLAEAREDPTVEVLEAPAPFAFNENGDLF